MSCAQRTNAKPSFRRCRYYKDLKKTGTYFLVCFLFRIPTSPPSKVLPVKTSPNTCKMYASHIIRLDPKAAKTRSFWQTSWMEFVFFFLKTAVSGFIRSVWVNYFFLIGLMVWLGHASYKCTGLDKCRTLNINRSWWSFNGGLVIFSNTCI